MLLTHWLRSMNLRSHSFCSGNAVRNVALAMTPVSGQIVDKSTRSPGASHSRNFIARAVSPFGLSACGCAALSRVDLSENVITLPIYIILVYAPTDVPASLGLFLLLVGGWAFSVCCRPVAPGHSRRLAPPCPSGTLERIGEALAQDAARQLRPISLVNEPPLLARPGFCGP